MYIIDFNHIIIVIIIYIEELFLTFNKNNNN